MATVETVGKKGRKIALRNQKRKIFLVDKCVFIEFLARVWYNKKEEKEQYNAKIFNGRT